MQDGDVKTIKGKAMADRFYISQLGEPYYDMLKIESWLKQRTMAAEANSILCSRLMQREEYRNRLVNELARKRGITFQQMWDSILTGSADVLSPEEYKQMMTERNPDE
jgi:hypothetical protein